MKNIWQILTLLLAVSLTVLSIKITLLENESPANNTIEEVSSPQDNKAAIIDNIMTRTSVRTYTTQKVEEEKIDTLLRAAMAAPSAGNKQPWSFVVIEDRKTLDALPSIVSGAHMAAKAQLAIVVCGTLIPPTGLLSPEYWIQDCSAATQNILLAAHGMGLGAVWCGAYPENGTGKVEKMSKLLNLPKDTFALNIIVIGYPDKEPIIKDKWNTSKIFYNKVR